MRYENHKWQVKAGPTGAAEGRACFSLASKFLGTLLVLAGLLSGAVIVDRIAVIVGKRVVKASDVERDLRVTHLLNNEPLDLSAGTRRKAAERLIDQELVRQEIMNGGYSDPSEQDVTTFLEQLTRDRFNGSEAGFREAMTRYGLSEEQLKRHLLWQLTVLRFIDERFRPGVLVTDQDVSAYYQAHPAERQKLSEAQVREILEGDRVNQIFEEWLAQARRRSRIEYREPSLRTEALP